MADSFDAVFARLRQIMLDAAPDMAVAGDQPGALELRTRAVDPKTRQPGWFGTVTIKKTYVAYHLMPLYGNAELTERISPQLARRKQGKTCFNFARSDEDLFKELAQLTRGCAASVAMSSGRRSGVPTGHQSTTG